MTSRFAAVRAHRRAIDGGREYRSDVHPLEYLRAIARHHGSDGVHEARDLAGLIADGYFEAAEVMVICRRIVEHRGDAAVLWWVCSEIATAVDPSLRAVEIGESLAQYTRDWGAVDGNDTVLDGNDTVLDSNDTVVVALATCGSALVLDSELVDGDRVGLAPMTHLDHGAFTAFVDHRRRNGYPTTIVGGVDPADGLEHPLPMITRVGHQGPPCRPAPELLRRSVV